MERRSFLKGIATGAVGLGVGAAVGYQVLRPPVEEPVPPPPVEITPGGPFNAYDPQQFATKAKIVIDQDKCQRSGGPLRCGGGGGWPTAGGPYCAAWCPMNCFSVWSPTEPADYDPPQQDWVITAGAEHLCVACMKCVEVCPYEAITIQVTKPGEV